MSNFKDEEYDFNLANDDEERLHWWQVMRNFLYYSEFAELELERRQKHLNKLSPEYQAKLPDVTFSKFKDIELALENNQNFFDDMVYFHATSGFSQHPNYIEELIKKNDPKLPKETLLVPHKDIGPAVDARQQQRNQATIHSVYREWSKEAENERKQSFGVLLEELQRLKPLEKKDYSLKVLVPGCGLGRLPLEIAALGYSCEGNEYSA